jgi:hypothetical protein
VDDSGFTPYRQALAVLMFSVVALIVVADSIGIGRRVDPVVLGILVTTGSALIAVDVRDFIRDITSR